MSKFIVPKERFVDHFITPLSRFDLPDKAAQVKLEDGNLIGVTHTDDRHVILEATIKDVKGDSIDPIILKDLNRLLSALGFVTESTMTFDVDTNNISYKDDLIKFKSYFLDDRFFDEKIPLKLYKIKELEFDLNFTITQDVLTKIKRSKQFVGQETDKVYFSGDDNGILASRHDVTKKSIDTISFNFCPEYSGIDFTPKPIHISIFDLISEKSESILVEVNSKYGLFMLTVDTTDYKLQYITSALRK